MSEWISVKDRLPEKGQDVLLLTDWFGGASFITIGYLGGTRWISYEIGRANVGIHVTHWMPLPEPPEEETE